MKALNGLSFEILKKYGKDIQNREENGTLSDGVCEVDGKKYEISEDNADDIFYLLNKSNELINKINNNLDNIKNILKNEKD